MPQIGQIKVVGRVLHDRDPDEPDDELSYHYTDDLDDSRCGWFEVWEYQSADPRAMDQQPGWVQIGEGSDHRAEIEQRAQNLKEQGRL
jgi:hypothetical protein